MWHWKNTISERLKLPSVINVLCLLFDESLWPCVCVNVCMRVGVCVCVLNRNFQLDKTSIIRWGNLRKAPYRTTVQESAKSDYARQSWKWKFKIFPSFVVLFAIILFFSSSRLFVIRFSVYRWGFLYFAPPTIVHAVLWRVSIGN